MPLDEALVQTVVDLSGRPFFVYEVKIKQARDRHLRRRADPRLPARAGEPGGHEPARPHAVAGATRTTSSRRRSRGSARALDAATQRDPRVRGRAVDQGHARRDEPAARHRRLRRRQPAQRARRRSSTWASRPRSPAIADAHRVGAGASCCPGRARSARAWRTSTSAGLVEPVLRRGALGAAVPRHLRRHAAPVRGERGVARRARARHSSAAAWCASRATRTLKVPHMGWNQLAIAQRVPALSQARRRRRTCTSCTRYHPAADATRT